MQQETRSHEDQVASAEAKVRRLGDALAEAKQELRDLRGAQAKERRAPRACGCGCGAMTGGGTFCPGHDARLRSRLLVLIDEGGDEGRAALAQLAQHPGLMHNVGEWRLGSVARERTRKEEAAAARKAETVARQAGRDADKAARERLQAESRKQSNAVAESAADRKRAQIAAAKSGGTVTVPSGK